ncbi:aminofutalosine deaminase family hydrolase [Nitratiruptor tergarcus]|uniref:Cytosine/adenosine deaminase n=1 Tax=Nitratiruptor tergarcus DSM 16512 TaxID=1069081 RepID=A0A1W1WS39_9BACT|nr:metal-dependent hydrolase [Nitratiruptor tergarcus]SMC09107.1 Cytosine/adenosine deaminase [Nitratiruptor tergarcus DSM 16512]
MQIAYAKYLLTPHTIEQDMAIAYDKEIIAIAPLEKLRAQFPSAEIHDYGNAALLPTFANPHVHLEFSANRATLSYGDFLVWLYSVIEHREDLLPRCEKECLEEAIKQILHSGTSAIGEISSYGEEMELCAASPLRVHFFNEIIGSNPAAADVMYASFIERYARSKKLESPTFKAGIAIHSPYSVHYILAKKALEIAKRDNALVSVHYAESRAEREWLDHATGPFKKFFKELLGQSTPANEPMRFLELFQDLRTLFVHMINTTDKERELLKNFDATIIHCPVSNRLLGNGVLDIDALHNPYTLATDGLSSNYSLNMYEEMRAALFMHPYKNAVTFAKDLIVKSTDFSHEILGFPGGKIAPGLPANFQIVDIPDDLRAREEIYLHIILHTQLPRKVIIDGTEL